MKLASAKLDENKNDEAKEILLQALNTLVIKEDIIPMPLLKAEQYLSVAATTMEGTDKTKKEIANILLDNADYQLKLAEVMGYGKKDKEFKEFAKAIKSLKKAIDKDEETKGLFDDLSKKMKDFKERLISKKK
jgi:tetratricopeptide (TPR) repeat protein